jgi:ribosomal protein S18 acetylase RimI-like enzyme
MATTGAAFTVRRAAADDADKLLFIWQETADMLSKSDRHITFAPDAADCWRRDLLEWLQRDDVAVFVAESQIAEGKVLGYIVGSIANNPPVLTPRQYGYVSELAIDSHAKMGGLGRSMLEALKLWFKERNLTHIEARVPNRHAIAQAFWRALGASELYDQMWLRLDK